jgi:hypothetical protein
LARFAVNRCAFDQTGNRQTASGTNRFLSVFSISVLALAPDMLAKAMPKPRAAFLELSEKPQNACKMFENRIFQVFRRIFLERRKTLSPKTVMWQISTIV